MEAKLKGFTVWSLGMFSHNEESAQWSAVYDSHESFVNSQCFQNVLMRLRLSVAWTKHCSFHVLTNATAFNLAGSSIPNFTTSWWNSGCQSGWHKNVNQGGTNCNHSGFM